MIIAEIIEQAYIKNNQINQLKTKTHSSYKIIDEKLLMKTKQSFHLSISFMFEMCMPLEKYTLNIQISVAQPFKILLKE